MLPNKVVSLSESIIWYFPDILEPLLQDSMKIIDLWDLLKAKIQDINTFLYCLDALYVLGKIQFNNESEMIEYVKED